MRTKSRPNVDVCGDCGAQDTSWASVNRGILLCIECCSIHRSLGRHISLVKSFQKSPWSNTQLNMVHVLNANGANNIWEHALENSKLGKRKPGPKDQLHVKAEFIRAKHQQCAFALRPNQEDGLRSVENELGKELHGSVRTGNLETSLRLLVQGADPNYFHDEKGSTPLHVAAKANQVNQAELLMVYGADPTYPDAQGKTPIDYAKQQVNRELANRMIEYQYEVTDKFSNYLSPHKVDHEKGVHFKIPAMGFKSNAEALAKLKKLPNYLFEELVMDIYDEVDRRETEAVWLSSADTMDLNANVVPFLPVNPSLSTTRNQGRQKLARYSTPELKTLVFDILVDIQRRQLNAEKGALVVGGACSLREFSEISDDEPLYDSVASDEDYSYLTCDEDAATTSRSQTASSTDMEFLTKKLQASDSTISHLQAEVGALKDLVKQLHSENNELKTRLSHSHTDNNAHKRINGNCLNGLATGGGDSLASLNGDTTDGGDYKQGRRGQRPCSMYETREGLKTPNWQTLKYQLKQVDNARNTTQSLYGTLKNQTIMQCMAEITNEMQQLWKDVQGAGIDDCVEGANKIQSAVSNLIAAVSLETHGETVKRLQENVTRLQSACMSLHLAHKTGNTQQCERFRQRVGVCAYEIAKDTKMIVTAHSPSN